MVVKHGGRGPGHLSRWPKAASGASLLSRLLASGAYLALDFSDGAYVVDDASGTDLLALTGSPVTYTRTGVKGELTASGAETVYGPELVTNGGFDSDLTGWTIGGGWVWSGGTAYHSTTAGNLAQDLSITQGLIYEITFDAVVTSGSPGFSFGGESVATVTTGSKSYIVRAGAGVAAAFTTGGAAEFSIDNVSVKQITTGVQYNAANAPGIVPGVGYWSRGSVTNLCLHNSDFTNAVWSKTNCTAAKTATGPDGVTNGASVLTATAGNATALQSITSASAQRISGCMVKRRTGSGTIEMTQDNGSTWTAITVTADWTQVSIPAATVTDPDVGFRIVTSGDAIDVAYFQHNTGVVVGPITATTSSTATVGADDMEIAIDALTDEDMLIFVEGSPQAATASQTWLELDAGSAANRIKLYNDAGAFGSLVTAASSDVYDASAGTVTAAERTLVLTRVSGDWRGGVYNGSTITWFGAATTGAMPTGLVKAQIGQTLTPDNRLDGPIPKAGIIPGTFDTDQKVIDAITNWEAP